MQGTGYPYDLSRYSRSYPEVLSLALWGETFLKRRRSTCTYYDFAKKDSDKINSL